MKPDKDQIRPNINEITVYGGSKDRHIMENHKDPNPFKYPVDHAYVMDEKWEKWTQGYDIGILELDEKSKPFFGLITGIYSDSYLLPICLAAKKFDFSTEKIHGVGYGLTYDEWPKYDMDKIWPKFRSPKYSSCMTNEVSNNEWKFLQCRMDIIKANGWSCEKKNLPGDITDTDMKECDKYFAAAEKNCRKNRLDYKMNEVHKIYVYEDGKTGEGEEKKICFRKKYFAEKGWCNVFGQNKNNNAWGFCSPSCDQVSSAVLNILQF